MCQSLQKFPGIRTQEKPNAAKQRPKLIIPLETQKLSTLSMDTPNYIREIKSYFKGYPLFFANAPNLSPVFLIS